LLFKIKILYRYLAVSILKNFLILLGIFSIVIVSSQLLHLPSIIYHAKFTDFLKILLLINFSFFKFILFFGFFISTTLVGYSLRENREIYAIFSAGISLNQLLKPIIYLSLLFFLLAIISSLWLVPFANRERANFITFSVRQYFLDSIQEKNFSNLSQNTVVYVEKREKGKFKNLFFFNKESGQIVTSQEAYFKGLNLTLKNGYIQLPSTNGINLIIFEKDKFIVDIDYIKNYEIEDFDNKKLLNIINSNDKNKYKALSILAERMFFPIPFLFIGILGFLIGLKSTKGKDYILALSILISIVYISISFYILKIISKGSFNPIIFVIFIILYFGSLVYYFNKK